MKPRRFTIGLYLLALAFLIVGLSACTQSLEEREAQPTQPVQVPAESGTPAVGGERAPAPGETVVSIATPAPQTSGTGTEPTVVTVGETPPALPTEGAQPPSATAVPSPSQPSQPSGGQANAVTHTVQQGETLSSIAQRYGTTWQAIANASGLQNPNQIYVGQKLTIPTGGGSTSGGTSGCRLRHTVQQGEWVWQIARRYGASPYDILAANGLTIQSANTIYPGTVLCIP
ncbi:MAG: LysM peptidoglycan-binding domain-containing protein [Anaerolineae bacterium]|nr:LysM peptidoglycan-binding domain-containing protein [Anaerolineae bacterium]